MRNPKCIRNVLPRYVIKKLANNTKQLQTSPYGTQTGSSQQAKTDDYIDSTRENIVAITETHLTDNHLSEEILHHFKDYTIHRSDKDTSIGRKTKFG